MNNLERFFDNALSSRQQAGILRKLKAPDDALIDFTSNDYLGLARSVKLRERIEARTKALHVKNGATGSRLLSGNSALHETLEQKLASTFKAEASLIFNSGYMANFGVLSSIPTRNDTILYDELSHASIKDGIRSSFAKKYPFRHNDLDDLEKKINRASGKVFIVVESIYSMDGDVCPLAEIVTLAEQYACYIVLDEAHSTGVIGPDGAGLAVSLGLQAKIAVRIYTFGKAMGIHGACVAGSRKLANYLMNFSRPFIYTTALADHTVVALLESFEYLAENLQLQDILQEKIRSFTSGINRSIHNTAIQTVTLGTVEATYKKSMQLLEQGFDVRPIFSPTVPIGSERLRICIHTFNTNEEIAKLRQLIQE